MKTSTKLFWGLLALILLWILMLFFEWDGIEKDISARVTDELNNQEFNWVSIDNDNHGRGVTLSGTARSQEQIEEAAKLVDDVAGVRDVFIDAISVKPLIPGSMKLNVDDNRVALSGELNSHGVESEFIDVANQTFGIPVDSQAKISADYALPSWSDDLKSMVSEMGQVSDAGLSVENGNLSVSGLVRSQDELNRLSELASGLGSFSNVDTSGLTFKPLAPASFNLVKSSAGEIKMAGAVDSESTINKITQAAAAAFPNGYSSEVSVGDGIGEPSWLEAATEMLPAIGQFDTAALEIIGDKANLAGTVRDPAKLESLRNLMGSSGNGLEWTDALDLLPPEDASLNLSSIDGEVKLSGSLPNVQIAELVSQRLSGYADEIRGG